MSGLQGSGFRASRASVGLVFFLGMPLLFLGRRV